MKRLSNGQPFCVVKGIYMKNYNEKHVLSIILQAAKEYDELLNDKHFFI